ncbi:MAG: nickel pincer cofactor biosynthesis protein LarB [Deltaproteobacteria bacterium]|nr:nickel pincer cofactor biosynthesis protein LarB [Deltaproteobacteria bacterium]
MTPEKIKELFLSFKKGDITLEAAIERLRLLPFEEIEGAMIDHHRTLRQGFPEVIYGESKNASQIIAIMEKMKATGCNILVTRLDEKKAKLVKDYFSGCDYDPLSRTLVLKNAPVEITGLGTILVICAGTSDIPIAKEAAITAELMGNRVETLFDVGISGIHRLFSKKDAILAANVLVVVAGMEGALPSVVGGLVSRPVIAVPTSVGYGVGLNGLAALLAMLNSCVAGVTVVNIDNGFGAGYAASLINQLHKAS